MHLATQATKESERANSLSECQYNTGIHENPFTFG
jgi:hypothetical protein